MLLSKTYQQYKSHYKTLLLLGIPIIIGQIGMIILGFADTFMIGHYGTSELGAAAFVNSLFGLVIIFSTGFAYGLTPVVGGFYGRGEHTQAGLSLRVSLVANGLVALLLTLAMLVLYLCLDKLGQPEELIPLMRPYYITLLISLLFVLLFNSFKQFTDAITFTKISMWILLFGNTLNIIGNYLLIYGKFGFPEMGLLGAGISTLTSRIVMLLIFVFVFLSNKRFAHYKEGFYRASWSGGLFKRLNALGWPVALQMGMETASFSLSAIMIGWLGTVALASHQIMCTISQLAFMVYYGMGAAVAVRVSNFEGQNDRLNVRRSAYAGFHLLLVLALVIGSAIFLLRYRIGGLFTSDAEIDAMVAILFIPMFIYQFGDALQINFANALRGIADVKPMIWIAFIAYFIISLPLGYFFGFIMEWGILGVWMAFPFGLTSAGIMLFFRFYHKTKSLN